MKNDINIECTVTAMSDELAAGIFRIASKRLLNVNTWNRLDGSLLSPFQLMDQHGNVVDREVHQNDYFTIHDSPETSFERYRWIRVERLEEQLTLEGSESITLQARPISDPMDPNLPGIAESSAKPGIFKVVKNGLNVTAGVYAEGDSDNDAIEVVDRMKSLSIAAYSTLGAYCVQWRSLVNAILGDLQGVDKFPI